MRERWLRLLERLVPLTLTVAVPTVAALWAVYVYTNNEREIATKRAIEQYAENRTRLIGLQKPFIDQQFSTYNEFTNTIGRLLVVELADKDWKSLEQGYWSLHWSRVALVEDEEVHIAKQNFAEALKTYTDRNSRHLNRDREIRVWAESVSGESSPSEAPKLTIMEKYERAEAEVRKKLEAASVLLTTALRKGIQKSWTGDLGK